MGRIGEYGRMARETVESWSDDDALTLAAAVAYYAIFSLAPLLILIVAIAGLVYGEQAAQGQLAGQLEATVGESGAQVLESSIAEAGGGPGGDGVFATVAGVALLLVGATGVFAQLQLSMNRIWNVRQDPEEGWWGTIRNRLTGVAVVAGLGLFVLATIVLSSVLTGLRSFVAEVPAGRWLWLGLDLIVSIGLLTFVFALLFKFVPDVEIEWEHVWFGAALTAVLFAVGKMALGFYIGSGAVGSAFGAASSLIIVLVWIYYSALIVFLGAEWTQVYAQRQGADIRPNEHAIRQPGSAPSQADESA